VFDLPFISLYTWHNYTISRTVAVETPGMSRGGARIEIGSRSGGREGGRRKIDKKKERGKKGVDVALSIRTIYHMRASNIICMPQKPSVCQRSLNAQGWREREGGEV